jgi:hypothetical protein
MSEFEGSPKSWPPLGLPTGSVRALLTLIVMAVVATKIVLGRELDSLWIETLLITLAHYFTSRRFVALSPEVLQRLEQDGIIEKERHPLYLPKNTIRTLIVGTFIGVGVFLFQEQRLFKEPQALALLTLVFAYLLGSIMRGITHWWARRQTKPTSGSWGDIRALIVLGALLASAIPELFLPDLQLHPLVNRVSLGLTLFYFGSR